jgi:hypothetical protein
MHLVRWSLLLRRWRRFAESVVRKSGMRAAETRFEIGNTAQKNRSAVLETTGKGIPGNPWKAEKTQV